MKRRIGVHTRVHARQLPKFVVFFRDVRRVRS